MNATPNSEPPHPVHAQIYVEQVRLLYAQAPLGTIASLLIAPMLVLIHWPLIPRPVLLAWLILLETTILVRWVLIVTFHHQQNPEMDTGYWASCYTWACAATGVIWGGSVVLLAHSPSPVYDAFIALILGGVLMGGALTMTPVLITYTAYALPLGLPPILWFLLHSDPVRIMMGITGILYLLLALGTAHRYHHTLVHSLRLAQENLNLAYSFAGSKKALEQNHQKLAEQQAALQDSLTAMRELYHAISTSYRRPSEQIQALLMMGCQRFGLDMGILSRVTGERYEVIQAHSPDNRIARGDVLDLDHTYCRETLQAQTPVGFTHAMIGEWHKHPCYKKFRLEAYLGTPVRMNNTVYGTLSFSGFTPRTTPLNTMDRELIQLMAEWVSGALEQERMTAAQQQQQALLAHASRLNTLGEMASGLAHEINQPITAITLYAETCMARLHNPAANLGEISQLIERVLAQSKRASSIIQHIRRFSRQGKVQHTTNSIHELIGEINDLLELETRRHDVYLRYDFAPELPPVRADRLQIQQVICNLVRNAVDAMDTRSDSRTVTVLAHFAADRAMIEIAVRDYGTGFQSVEMEQMLLPFFTTKPEGLGLGLPISQSIVEAHGGCLWATANTESAGTTFHFTLPTATCAGSSPTVEHPVSLETDTRS